MTPSGTVPKKETGKNVINIRRYLNMQLGSANDGLWSSQLDHPSPGLLPLGRLWLRNHSTDPLSRTKHYGHKST